MDPGEDRLELEDALFQNESIANLVTSRLEPDDQLSLLQTGRNIRNVTIRSLPLMNTPNLSMRSEINAQSWPAKWRHYMIIREFGKLHDHFRNAGDHVRSQFRRLLLSKAIETPFTHTLFYNDLSEDRRIRRQRTVDVDAMEDYIDASFYFDPLMVKYLTFDTIVPNNPGSVKNALSVAIKIHDSYGPDRRSSGFTLECFQEYVHLKGKPFLLRPEFIKLALVYCISQFYQYVYETINDQHYSYSYYTRLIYIANCVDTLLWNLDYVSNHVEPSLGDENYFSFDKLPVQLSQVTKKDVSDMIVSSRPYLKRYKMIYDPL